MHPSRREGQADGNDGAGRAIPRRIGPWALRRDHASHRLDKPACDGQAKTGAGPRAVRTSDPIEAVKHLRQIGLRNARTFIGNGDADLVTATCAADTDQRPIRAVTR